MEIFQDGELEEEMDKRDLRANSLGTWWKLFSETYEEMVQAVANPVRADYSVRELGDRQFTIETDTNESQAFVREDFCLENVRGEQLVCSFWRRKEVRNADPIADSTRPSSHKRTTEENLSARCLVGTSADVIFESSSHCNRKTIQLAGVDPCIIYLHGLSSSRKECIYLHKRVLGAGFSLFALDLSGSGHSGGDRVSFGYFEQDDVRTVVNFLYATGRASAVGLWGRDIGSVAALLHVKKNMAYQYQVMTVSTRDLKTLVIEEDHEEHHLLCIIPPSRMQFRFSNYSAANGDFVLLSIDNFPVQGLSAATCHRLIQQSCKRNGGLTRLKGYKRSASKSRRNDSFTFALVADSTYGDMEEVLWDSLQMITKSAERRNLFFPSPMVTAVQKILASSIGKAGGFNLRDVRLLDAAPEFTLPCLFISASKRDFFMPHHAKLVCDRYGGPKSYIQFTGQIGDNRPVEVLDAVISHFARRCKVLRNA